MSLYAIYLYMNLKNEGMPFLGPILATAAFEATIIPCYLNRVKGQRQSMSHALFKYIGGSMYIDCRIHVGADQVALFR